MRAAEAAAQVAKEAGSLSGEDASREATAAVRKWSAAQRDAFAHWMTGYSAVAVLAFDAYWAARDERFGGDGR